MNNPIPSTTSRLTEVNPYINPIFPKIGIWNTSLAISSPTDKSSKPKSLKGNNVPGISGVFYEITLICYTLSFFLLTNNIHRS